MLELFGAKSACTEAGEGDRFNTSRLKLAAEWDQLLGAQIQVIKDARELEREAVSARFLLEIN